MDMLRISTVIAFSCLVAGLSFIGCTDEGVIETYTVATQPVSNVVVADVGNQGTAQDLQVSFDPPEHEEGIKEYRLIVIKSSDAKTFDLDSANSVPPGNYVAVAKSGDSIKLSLPVETKDKDGDLIAIGVVYRIFVLTVADRSNAHRNALSEASNEIAL
jgi:hypothetical protein